MSKGKKKHSKVVKAGIITFSILLGIYVITSMYFSNHFYLGSSINSISVSGKTIDEAHEEILSEADSYLLELKGKDGVTDSIKGREIDLKYDTEEEVKRLKDKQNPFGWIIGIFSTDEIETSDIVSFNEEKLKEKIDALSFFDSKNIVESKNAGFEYKNNEYRVINEIYGNSVDKEYLYSNIVSEIYKGGKIIDLESAKCYKEPEYKADSKETKEIVKTLNKYVDSKITYTVADHPELIDGRIINQWLTVNDNYEVVFDESKVKEYVNSLGSKYNTFGKTRKFTTTEGKVVSVPGGDYGWKVDTTDDVSGIIADIKEGKTTSRDAEYTQTAFAKGENDIGKTYVEINLSKQHMWFYKDGALVVEGDIVTGNVSLNHTTPAGTYRLKYKQRDTVLKGEDYESPVSFWMPFNGGIGLHDATWRGTFGGSIYKTNGSHGCVNLPYPVASKVFSNIEAGTPIVCYVE
ncbi:peptidoglycan binding domain-containing protein [Clostridium paraputrificum]|uniref:L,D-transpeptidase family protein n=1 Tax=Clostridium paraputrificum TaxID=29363 RepID=UPI003D3566FB